MFETTGTVLMLQSTSSYSLNYTKAPFRVLAFSIMTWGSYGSSYFISRQKSWSATNLLSST